jgi:hypothetical protein
VREVLHAAATLLHRQAAVDPELGSRTERAELGDGGGAACGGVDVVGGVLARSPMMRDSEAEVRAREVGGAVEDSCGAGGAAREAGVGGVEELERGLHVGVWGGGGRLVV